MKVKSEQFFLKAQVIWKLVWIVYILPWQKFQILNFVTNDMLHRKIKQPSKNTFKILYWLFSMTVLMAKLFVQESKNSNSQLLAW